MDGAGTMIFGGEEMTVSGYASHGAGSVPSDPFFVDVTDGTIQITCW